ncbi:TetR/AcrR family transcriptional regulator [Demequina lutea]|uniref:AcrR family transcriptional regulator n=1 Tax=Demequina lutea TaxID=431489 RepID=A0A7Y9ZAM6_9MICO|nr:TetR/AcrR family transcriptional regulator [Demequina lutea]NYI41854.1 AcrR family transcriptional regulator [Demequina lutea]
MHTVETPDEAIVCPQPGLRERKREATRRRVEKAAIELALANGLEHVTVDQICEASDISARTFFNYFGSKENAMIGIGSKLPSPEAVEAFVTGMRGPILEDFLVMLARTFAERGPDVALFRARRDLFSREPQLAAMQMAKMTAERDEFTTIVKRRVATANPDLIEAAQLEEAILVVGVGMGALHVVGHQWHESSGEASLEDLVHQLLPRLRRVTESSRRPIGA